MNRSIWMTIVCLIAPMAALAQGSAANPVTETLRRTLDRYSKNLVATAEEMPADKYGYQPTKEEMTFGETIAHIAEVNNFACSKSFRHAGAIRAEDHQGGFEGKAGRGTQSVDGLLHAGILKADRCKTCGDGSIFGREISDAAGRGFGGQQRSDRPLRGTLGLRPPEWAAAAHSAEKTIGAGGVIAFYS